jgi:Leucine-rich repeat (LRR) protein
MTGTPHDKEISDARQYHGVVSSSRSASSFSLDRGTFFTDKGAREKRENFVNYWDGKVGYVENKKAMKYKIEERSSQTDNWIYFRRGIVKNVVMDGVIREGKTSNDLRCAIYNDSHDRAVWRMDELAFLKDLEWNGFHGNPAGCREPLCRLSDRKTVLYLDLSNKKLDRVPGCIERLEKLQDLDLSSNQIRKIENIGNLEDLLELNFYHNRIRKIEGLEATPLLDKLYLHDNLITKIEGLEGLELNDLHLSGNKIPAKECTEADLMFRKRREKRLEGSFDRRIVFC